ncbi:MAG: LPS export ABC transporter periplasmic protein LptC [Gammaproteobacteria bacterium]|nr:LPS export ABC transporter periplasmic protein LptC [Gammaproteobacteria bacterium]NNC77454.1 LPS export ABC transporter periplasmic protein LptC [Woeseiaceae bacterium]
MTPRHTVMVVLLTAAALGTWYLASQHDDALSAPGVDGEQHRGYYLKSARILGTGSDGSLLYEINAVRAEQQAGNRIEFSDVRIQYSPQSEVPWTLVADSAMLFPDQNRVTLRGHVLAVSKEGFSGDETEIRTPYLELDPDQFVAETDERVQIRIGARSLTGTGMLASLKENRMEIKSNVSGRFIP